MAHRAIEVVQITIGGEGSAYILAKNADLELATLFDGAELGDWYELKLIEMNVSEFAALPEFAGS